MLKSFCSRCFLLTVFLLLWPATVPAQQMVMPPPSAAASPPPDPDLLPQPPALQWWSLGPKSLDDESSGPEAIAIPPPQPEASIAPPPPPVIDAPALNPPSPAELELAKPDVEVWRSGSERPQIPPRQYNRLEPAYITGTEPVWLRVQFDPLAAGKHVFVKPSRGITLDLPVAIMTISNRGECLFLAQLDEHVFQSHIIFYCEGVKTVLPVLRASLAKVEEKEAESGGGE